MWPEPDGDIPYSRANNCTGRYACLVHDGKQPVEGALLHYAPRAGYIAYLRLACGCRIARQITLNGRPY